jgi:hypothetical protein
MSLNLTEAWDWMKTFSYKQKSAAFLSYELMLVDAIWSLPFANMSGWATRGLWGSSLNLLPNKKSYSAL